MAAVTDGDWLRSAGAAAVVAYLALWLLLVVHCLRREAFFPVLGHGKWTRLFWLASFLFFNPLLTLLYGVFGVMASGQAKPSWRKSAFVVGAVALVIASGWILPLLTRGPTLLVRDPFSGEMQGGASPLFALQAPAGVLRAGQEKSATVMTRGADRGRLACRHVAILAESPGLFLDRVARQVQQALAEIPCIQKADYFPAGSSPPVGSCAPDLVISLYQESITETRLPLYRRLAVAVSVTAAPTRYPPNWDTWDALSPPTLEFVSETSVDFSSSMWGVELPGGRYGLESESLGSAVAKELEGRLSRWGGEHGLLPELPEAFFGAYREPVDLPFLNDHGASLVQSHSGLMSHNATVWRLSDTAGVSETLESIEQRMALLGWDTKGRGDASGGNPCLHMVDGARRLLVNSHKPERAGSPGPSKSFVVVHYQDRLDKPEITAALTRLVDEHGPIEALLTFSGPLRESSLAEAFELRLRQAKTSKARLVLAGILLDRDETDEALGMLDEARVLVSPMTSGATLDGFKKLYEQAGLDPPEDMLFSHTAPDKDLLNRVGYVDYDAERWPVERTVAPGEFITLYGDHPDGGMGRMWIRMRPCSGPAGTCSMETTDLHMGSSSHSWGYASLGPGDHMSQRTTYREHWLHDAEKPLILEVELLENGNFRFVISGHDERLAMRATPR